MKNLILCNIFAALAMFGVTAMQDGASSTGEPAGSPLRRIGSSIQLREVDDFAQRTVFDIPVVPCKDSKTGTTKASKPKTKEDIEKEIRPMLQTCIDRLGSKRLVSDKRGNKIEVEVIDISCRSIMRYARRVQDQVDEKYELIPFLDLVDTIISRTRGSDDWAQTAFVGDELEQFHRRFCGSQLWFRGLIHPKVANNLRSFYRNFTTFQTFASLFIVDALNRSGGKIAFAAPLSLEINIGGDMSACAFGMNMPELRRVTIQLSKQYEENVEKMEWALNHECLHMLQYQLFGIDFIRVFGEELDLLSQLTCLNSRHDFEDLFYPWLNKCALFNKDLSSLIEKIEGKTPVVVPESLISYSYDLHCEICRSYYQMCDHFRRMIGLDHVSADDFKQRYDAMIGSCCEFLNSVEKAKTQLVSDKEVIDGQVQLIGAELWSYRHFDGIIKAFTSGKLQELINFNSCMTITKQYSEDFLRCVVNHVRQMKVIEGETIYRLRQLSLSRELINELMHYVREHDIEELKKENWKKLEEICVRHDHFYADKKNDIIKLFEEAKCGRAHIRAHIVELAEQLNTILTDAGKILLDSDLEDLITVYYSLLHFVNVIQGLYGTIDVLYNKYRVVYNDHITEIHTRNFLLKKYESLSSGNPTMIEVMVSMARLWNTNYSDKLVIGGLLPISDTLWIVNDQHECIQAKRDRMIKGATVCKSEEEWGVYRPHSADCIDKQFCNKMTEAVRKELEHIFKGVNFQNADMKPIRTFISQGAFYPQALMHVEHPRTSEVESVEEEPTKDVTD